MRLLVIEDDPDIAGYIGRGLTAMGHDTQLADSAASAMSACHAGLFDAIVLDRMLPDGNGIMVMERLRRDAGARSPILMLSALASVEDRIEGLLAGADDYLTKPFNMAELNARIAAVVRRGKAGPSSDHATVGQLALDPAGHRACFMDREIALNRKEYSLLAFLMRHADRLVTRAMLLEGVWDYDFEPTTNIVESNLSRLRTRLQQVDCDPIETRRGEGYVLRSERCA